MNNRLQFRHHTPIFENRDEAIEYIYSQIRFTDDGLAFEDKSYGFSLLGEPTILRYKNVTEGDASGEKDPHIIIAVGSVTNEGNQYGDNHFCIIDIDKTESEIANLEDELAKAVRSLSIITRDTNTLKLHSSKTDDGTIISGDVVVAASQIFDDARKPNIILNTEDGLFTYVNMEFDKDNDKISFTVNGDTKEWTINNNYLVRGYYSKKDESLHLIRKDDVDIAVSLENLIDEWGVEGEASNTPIVLTKEEVGYGDDALHNHVEPWQDVLKADVRLADRKYNVLKKTSDGRYLYVDGLASNITFFKDGQEISVQDALTSATKGTSNDSTNIIYEKADGYYATASLKYRNKENKLIFTSSNVTGGTTVEEIQLNAVEVFKKVYYDTVTENLVIMYVDGNGDLQEVDVPIGEMMTDWEWDIVNDGHNVKLHKQRVINGNDKISADVDIAVGNDNILEDVNHQLYVKGTADNIKYGRDGNVGDELDKLISNTATMSAKLNETSGKVDTLREEFNSEVTRATSEEQRIESKLDAEISRSSNKDTEHDSKISTIQETIGTGFTTDGHETITYKFNELSAKTNVVSSKVETNSANIGLLSAKTEAEVVRAKGEEQRIEKKFDDSLGEGFNIRNTVRDEIEREKSERIAEDGKLQAEIDVLSANTDGRLIDINNIDGSIGIDKTDAVRPIVKVKLSEEVEDGKENIIKLNADGIYAGVDLDYYFESGTSKNVLVFKTTNGTKTFDLKTNSVVDKIYYDPTKEAIIIEYTVNGKRMPDVEIPVHDLINEWRVSEDTNGAIKLYKFRESGATQDVLYAETIISDHEDNILVNDNGSLYVSDAQIEQNKADIAALDARLGNDEARISNLEDGLAQETQRATNAEHTLHDEIVAETNRATNAEDALNTKVDNEISRSIAKDEELETRINSNEAKITTEISDRTQQFQTLRDEIEAEKDRAREAESNIASDLSREVVNRTNGDVALQASIDAETRARESGDNALQGQITTVVTNLSTERQERIAADTTLDGKITNEINRAIEAEGNIATSLNNEITRATEKESLLSNQITSANSRAVEAEVGLRRDLANEIERSTREDDELDGKIDAEANARSAEDTRIWYDLNNNKLLFEDTLSVDFTRTHNEGVADVVKADVKLSSKLGNVLTIKDGPEQGLYSTAILKYNEATNVLGIYDDNDTLISEKKLGAGSLLDSIDYDNVGKNLIIKYHNADGTAFETTFNVSDIFNEWIVQNPPSGSAIELWKTENQTESGTIDYISGKVLLTAEVNPDGTIDYGDNIIRIVNNGLYVPGSGITKANETSECVKNEIKVVEQAVLGETITQECGEGYGYKKNPRACFISGASSMYNADEILDAAVCENRSRIDALETGMGDIGCLTEELNVTQENVLGFNIPNCGKNQDGSLYKYAPNEESCFIKDARNMNEADKILDTYVCSAHTRIDVLEDKVECISGETKSIENVLGVQGNCSDAIAYPTSDGCLLTSADTFVAADRILEKNVCDILNSKIIGEHTNTATVRAVEDGLDTHLFADVRLSHGKERTVEDSEITITRVDDEQFTDTNVLNIVNILSDGETILPNDKYNGLFLSNVWDCKEYTEGGVGTPSNKYRTDDSESAMNYYERKYRNGKRYRNEL